MEYLFVIIITLCLSKYAASFEQRYQLCDNSTHITRSCTTQILGKEYSDNETCQVVYIAPNSSSCSKFGPLESNAHIGGVSLRPYILLKEHQDSQLPYSANYTVLNITFTNIKWKTMKFRFKNVNRKEKHCRNIVISNDVTINDKSVLYYDCYWSLTDGNYNGQSHILDFEATDDVVVNRGQYYFNIPSAQMLSPTISEKDWKPFIYIEKFARTMKLHIMPPPSHLKITSYKIEVMKECDYKSQCEECVKIAMLKLKNNSVEITYDYSLPNSPDFYYFILKPIHEKCELDEDECQYVESPRINGDAGDTSTTQICVASVTALILGVLFVYYVVMVMLRRYLCREYGHELPPPTKVLIVYPTANRLHAECVASFASYLRSEFGFDIMYDGDITNTSHGDPYVWAEEAFRLASHLVYVVGPAEDTNMYNNIYDKPIITAHKDVDIVILSLLRASRANRKQKEVMNVFFDHSDDIIPVETRHDKVYFLIKDWQKFIADLSRNLLPKRQIMRTEKGKCFLDDLSRAKKLLSNGRDDHVIKFDKSCHEKKAVV